jgi:hypothetical protein
MGKRTSLSVLATFVHGPQVKTIGLVELSLPHAYLIRSMIFEIEPGSWLNKKQPISSSKLPCNLTPYS